MSCEDGRTLDAGFERVQQLMQESVNICRELWADLNMSGDFGTIETQPPSSSSATTPTPTPPNRQLGLSLGTTFNLVQQHLDETINTGRELWLALNMVGEFGSQQPLSPGPPAAASTPAAGRNNEPLTPQPAPTAPFSTLPPCPPIPVDLNRVNFEPLSPQAGPSRLPPCPPIPVPIDLNQARVERLSPLDEEFDHDEHLALFPPCSEFGPAGETFDFQNKALFNPFQDNQTPVPDYGALGLSQREPVYNPFTPPALSAGSNGSGGFSGTHRIAPGLMQDQDLGLNGSDMNESDSLFQRSGANKSYASFSKDLGPFDCLVHNCPKCKFGFFLKIKFIYNGLNARNQKEQEIKSRISIVGTGEVNPFEEPNDIYEFLPSPPHYLSMNGTNTVVGEQGWVPGEEEFGGGIDGSFLCGNRRTKLAPGTVGGVLCPNNPPFEFKAVGYQSFDRMAASCPYCRQPLYLKSSFTYLGPNATNTQEHEIKLSLKVYSDPQPNIRPRSC